MNILGRINFTIKVPYSSNNVGIKSQQKLCQYFLNIENYNGLTRYDQFIEFNISEAAINKIIFFQIIMLLLGFLVSFMFMRSLLRFFLISHGEIIAIHGAQCVTQTNYQPQHKNN